MLGPSWPHPSEVISHLGPPGAINIEGASPKKVLFLLSLWSKFDLNSCLSLAPAGPSWPHPNEVISQLEPPGAINFEGAKPKKVLFLPSLKSKFELNIYYSLAPAGPSWPHPSEGISQLGPPGAINIEGARPKKVVFLHSL